MSRLNNWFLLDPEFMNYDVSDDNTTSGCGNCNGSGCGEGSGNGYGDINGKIIDYVAFHLYNFDDDPNCGIGIRGGSGVGFGFGDSCGSSNGRGY